MGRSAAFSCLPIPKKWIVKLHKVMICSFTEPKISPERDTDKHVVSSLGFSINSVFRKYQVNVPSSGMSSFILDIFIFK